MRSLNRNKTTIHYALYSGSTEATKDGLYTGEVVATYATPVTIRASVSAARGTSDIDLFGINISYSKAVIVDDLRCPIDEHSRLWIGRQPTDANGLDVPHNYEVVAVAKSLNHITYAVKEVDFALPPTVSA